MAPMMLAVYPILVLSLLGELEDRGLPVPQVARHAVELLEGLDKLLPQPNTSDLLTLDVDQLSELARRTTAHRVQQVDLGNTLSWFGTSLVLELQQDMADHVDPILDALREQFDQAALEVHSAVQLGIVPGLLAPEAILMALRFRRRGTTCPSALTSSRTWLRYGSGSLTTSTPNRASTAGRLRTGGPTVRASPPEPRLGLVLTRVRRRGTSGCGSAAGSRRTWPRSRTPRSTPSLTPQTDRRPTPACRAPPRPTSTTSTTDPRRSTTAGPTSTAAN